MRRTAPSISQGIKWSLIGHVGALTLLLLKTLVLPDTHPTYIPSLRVDLVALPDVLKKDQALPVSEAQKKANAEIKKILEREERTPQKTESKQVAKNHEMTFSHQGQAQSRSQKNLQALKRLKSLSRMESLVNESSHSATSRLIKGNQLSAGNSVDGDARETAEPGYKTLIKDRLHDHFENTPWLSRQGFSAQVTIFISHTGELLKYQFQKNSGNDQFDSAVKKAISQSHPFPRPPAELSRVVMSRGLSFKFPL